MENSLVQQDFMLDSMLDVSKFEQLQRAATLFSKSGLVPQTFKENPAACFVGLQLAAQLGVNPFMLFQRLYTVGSKIGIEAQLAIGIANQKKVFKGAIQYTFAGKGETRSCTAKAVLNSTGETVEMTVDWATVAAEGWNKRNGSKWLTMPDLMFRYRSAMWLIRTYAPEVLLGLQSVEEMHDGGLVNVTPRKTIDEAFAEMQGEPVAKPVEAVVIEAEIVPEPAPEKPKKSPPKDVKTVPVEAVEVAPAEEAPVAGLEALAAEFDGTGVNLAGSGAVYVVKALGHNKPQNEWTEEDYVKVIRKIKELKK